jgi:hypothetical protein
MNWVIAVVLSPVILLRLRLRQMVVGLALLDLIGDPILWLPVAWAQVESRPLTVIRMLGFLAGACVLLSLVAGCKLPHWLLPVKGRWSTKLLLVLSMLGLIQAGPWAPLIDFMARLTVRHASAARIWLLILPVAALYISTWVVFGSAVLQQWDRRQQTA